MSSSLLHSLCSFLYLVSSVFSAFLPFTCPFSTLSFLSCVCPLSLPVSVCLSCYYFFLFATGNITALLQTPSPKGNASKDNEEREKERESESVPNIVTEEDQKEKIYEVREEGKKL